jgi:hypothetical protein
MEGIRELQTAVGRFAGSHGGIVLVVQVTKINWIK